MNIENHEYWSILSLLISCYEYALLVLSMKDDFENLESFFGFGFSWGKPSFFSSKTGVGGKES